MYTLYVNLNSQELELGSIDPNYFSLYMLWEATMGEAGKDFHPQHDKCITHAYLPWSGEMRLVESDSDLLEVFYQFGQHDTYIIHFDMEPLSLNGQPHTAPILQSSDDVDVFVEQEHGSGSEEDDKDEILDIESEDEPQTPVISDYVIQEGFDLDRVKNEKSQWTGKCKGANGNCTWRIHASPVINHFTYQIKSFNNTHICNRQTKRLEVTATWIARKYKTFIMENPDIKISILGTELLKDYNVAVSKQKLHGVRTIALEGSNENQKKSNNKFWKYGNIVRIKNQGSMTMLKLHQPLPGGPQHFLRFFLSFEAQKYGYLVGYRPFIGIDGCHLKNRYGGMLLSAVGIDANYGIFPIAVCICEEETSESWGWFLEHLYQHLHKERRRMPCFMSDHQKGVLQAMKLFWPDAGIRHCARHMYANIKAEWKGPLYKTLFYAAVKTCDVHEFKATMQKIWNLDNEAYNYMMEYDPKHLSRHAFDPYICTDHVTNNITECWNGVINKFRRQSVLTMLESIRRKLMKKLEKRRTKAHAWKTKLPPVIHRKIKTLQEKARELPPIKGNSRNVVSKSSQSPTRTMSYEVGNSSNTVVGMSSQPVVSVTQHESQEMEAPFSQQYVYGAGENTTTNAEDNPNNGRLDLNWDDLL
ncbi:hypothetical protein Q3G72_012562 [Acer saccharum]|nr:hypothetical protein Q3G72_012562 [Acer saccharum]